MSTAEIRALYADRRAEIEAYIDLLSTIETETRRGPPKIGESGAAISVLQQRILYANVYLHLYNLVEATISTCLEALCEEVAGTPPSKVGDLVEPLLEQWVRFVARTSTEMGADKRLKAALALTQHLLDDLPVEQLEIDLGGGGNWDDREIERIAQRVGCSLAVSPEVRRNVKIRVRDDLGPMGIVKDLRNRLAHGSLSFAECGTDVTVNELADLSEKVLEYLAEVVDCFITYVDGRLFLSAVVS